MSTLLNFFSNIFNFLVKMICTLLLWIFRFKAEPLPNDLKKAVVVIAPHTSNWDFFILVLIKFRYHIKLNWFAKKQMFKFPYSKFLIFMGGIPIDRSKENNIVTSLVNKFEEKSELLLAITPEGTRRHRDYWKSGFYHVAQQAQVPIIFYVLDYQNRVGRVGHIMYPESIEKDFITINSIYSKSQARHPDKFSNVRLKPPED